MSSRRLLFECTVVECGHLFQIWVEADELHIHAECDDCQAMALDVVGQVYGHLPVSIVD